MKFSFFRGERRLDVALCYECKILRVALDGLPVGLEDFDPVAPLLVDAALRLFPDDPEIQALQGAE